MPRGVRDRQTYELDTAKSGHLLVEGRDAFEFFRRFVLKLGISDMQVHNGLSVAEMPGSLAALVSSPGFADQVTSLGIIRDREDPKKDAFASLRDKLRRINREMPFLDLPVPERPAVVVGGRVRVGIFILPDADSGGMLETLCLRALEGDPAAPCVEGFLECLKASGAPDSRNVTKARFHAFLASRPRPGLQIGQALEADYLNFSSSAYDPLKVFLTELAASDR